MATDLKTGTHRVGGSRHADVRSRDASVAPFHAQIDIDDHGRLRWVQLAGRCASEHSTGWTEVDRSTPREPDVVPLMTVDPTSPGVHVDLGGSRLQLTPIAVPQVEPTRADVHDGRTTVRRAPRAVPVWAPEPITVPVPSSVAGVPMSGLVPAVLGLVGAVGIAVVLHQPMFLLFGLIGGLVAIGGWGAQQWSAWRRRRRGQASARSDLQHFAASLALQRREHATVHRAVVGTLDDAVLDVADLRPSLWARRPDDDGAFLVAGGLGDVRWEPELAPHASIPDVCWTSLERDGVHHDAAIPVDLGADARLAVSGPEGAAAVRSMLVQLAARVGPADWQLVVVSDRADEWAWAAQLPHLVVPATAPPGAHVFDDDAAAALCRDADRLDGRHTVVVTDGCQALSMRTGPVRRLAAGDLHPALIVLCDSVLDVPAICRAVLETAAGGRGRWLPELTSGRLPLPIRVTGLHEVDAAMVCSRLGDLIDPEDPRHAGGALPREVSLATLLSTAAGAPTAASIAASWRAAPADVAPATPIGVAADGIVELDLVRDGPHALLAGTTGAGKSELLRSLVLGLAVRLSPEQLTFVLVDYKGGATFDCCLRLPHVVGLVTDLDDRLAERALRSLRAELRRRELILRERGVADLTALRRTTGAPGLPRLLVVIDEFAALAAEHPSFLHALVGIAQRGRSLGVHLLLATQRPNGVISDDIRANTNLRMALRLHDVADAMDVIGDAAPAALARDVPGRAVMRLGPAELVEFQTAHVGVTVARGRTSADLLADEVVAAAALLDLAVPHRPWLAPLPITIEPIETSVGSRPSQIGLVDLPDLQEQRPLRWRPATGNLLVVGAQGSGVSSTLRTAAIASLDEETELLVVDALGDRTWDEVAAHPRCAGVVRLHERERLIRLLARVGAPTATNSRTVLVIDGLGALRAELDGIDRMAEADLLARSIAGTGQPGLALAIGVPDAVSVPSSVLARCPHRWLLHVNDAHDATVLGIAPSLVPADIPGRAIVLGAIDDVAEPVEAQLVRPVPVAEHETASAHPVERLGVLPTCVDASAVGASRREHDNWSCPLGLAFETLAPTAMVVPDGEHVLVLGPARSGRSAVLVRMLHAWVEAHAAAGTRSGGEVSWIGVLAPRRSPVREHAASVAHIAHIAYDVLELLEAMPATGPVFVIVDDAELVDDVDGRLAALVASRRPGLLVATAGRAEGLRAAYGHWTGAVRRSRRGVLMAGCHETDGDLLGVTLPRHSPIATRPGLAHLVEDGGSRLVQCALDPEASAADPLSARHTTGDGRRPRAAERNASRATTRTTGLTAVS